MAFSGLRDRLLQSLSPDAAVRNSAEQAVREMVNTPGFLVALLEIVTEQGVEPQLQQLATILLKNDVKGRQPHNADVIAIRSDVLRLSMSADINPSVGEGMRYTLAAIVCNLHASWPELFPTLLTGLTSAQPLVIRNTCFAVARISSRIAYIRHDEADSPVVALSSALFPLLHQIATVSMGLNTLDAAKVLAAIFKTLLRCCNMRLPPAVNAPDTLAPWLDLAIALLGKPLPDPGEAGEPAGQPSEYDERVAWPWWKAKKWAAAALQRICVRFSYEDGGEPTSRAIAVYLKTRAIPNALPNTIIILSRYATGKFVSPQVGVNCLNLLGPCVEFKEPYRLLKPHVNNLLWRVIMPILAFTDRDRELWVDSPEEYLKKLMDVMVALYDPRSSATSLLVDLLKRRAKDTLRPFWDSLKEQLEEYITAAPADKVPQKQYALLTMFGASAHNLVGNRAITPQLEGAIMKYVAPEFQSPAPFMRLRACLTFGELAELVSFSNSEHFKTCVVGIVNCFDDPEIPVRYGAASAFRFVVQNPDSKEILAPVLPGLLSKFFGLMGDVPSDEVITTLEAVINMFSDAIGPVAIPLLSKLAETWVSLASKRSEDEEDDNIAMAFSTCLSAILTVYAGISENAELMSASLAVTGPLLVRLLEGDDLLECSQIVNLLSYAVKASPLPFPHELWAIIARFYHQFTTLVADFADEALPLLALLLSKDAHGFLSGAGGRDYVEDIFTIAETNIASDELSAVAGVTGVTWLFQYCASDERMNACAKRTVEFCVAQMENVPRAVVPYLLACIAKVLNYNVVLAVTTLQSVWSFQEFLTKLSHNIDNIRAVAPAQTVAVGLTALLKVPPSALPPAVLALAPAIVKNVVHALGRWDTAQAAAEAGSDLSSDDEDDDYDDEEEDDGEEEEEEDKPDKEDLKYMAEVKKMMAKAERAKKNKDTSLVNNDDEAEKERKAREKAKKKAAKGSDEDDEEDDDEEEEEDVSDGVGEDHDSLSYPSYTINPYVYFSDAMGALTATYPELTSNLHGMLDDASRAALQAAIARGVTAKAEAGAAAVTTLEPAPVAFELDEVI